MALAVTDEESPDFSIENYFQKQINANELEFEI
jgi:hypothetical protein